MSTESFTIRALGYSDLPQVIAIERRSFPTPWSLSMFVPRALEALRDLPGRDRDGVPEDDRLPGLLPLRPGLASDERRRRIPPRAGEGWGVSSSRR